MIRSIGSTTPRATMAVLACAIALAGTTAAAAATHTGTRARTVGPATGVPKGFRANSVTWTSALLGWALGDAPCGQNTCTYVIATTNGGSAWHLQGKIDTPIAHITSSTVPGVDEIRFATAKVGWAFTPFLFHTTDGGHTWTKLTIPGAAKQVVDLAANHTEAFLLTSTCAWGSGFCNKKPLGFWRNTHLTGNTWSQLSVTVPVNIPGDGGAHVTLFGSTVYVADPQVDSSTGDKLFVSTDGVHFASRSVPCAKLTDSHLFRAIPYSATDVALLCVGNPGLGKSDKVVFRSTDTGQHDTNAGIMNKFGNPAQLAASPSGNLASSSQSGGSFIDINDTKTGTTWIREVNKGDGGVGWNDIVYVTNRTAWVVYAPAMGANPDNTGDLYVTRDAGHTWNRVRP